MKKIDKILLTSFIGPFVVSFGIALFVLVMQVLWLYIDDIAGKGVSIFILIELIAYMSISLFPTALPIAVLLASVMVMGNLAERYELTSMKSAGASLIRIMRSLMVCGALIAFFSYVCSDFIIPAANLQFKSRLYDIRKQKPALAIEKGVFNEDFRQFVIRVGDKERDGETIKDVLIEDQTDFGRVKFNQILADSGQMFTTKDKRFFVMNLFNGTQYQEPGNQTSNPNQKSKAPFIRTNFKSWSKVWDMREFEFTSTDQDRFKQQRSMLSMSQLRSNMDSITKTINAGRLAAAEDLTINLRRMMNAKFAAPDSIKSLSPVEELNQQNLAKFKVLQEKERKAAAQTGRTEVSLGPKLPKQVLQKPLTEYGSIEETFVKEDHGTLLKEALVILKRNTNIIETRMAQIESRRKDYAKTGYELFTKYSFALVCFIFLFIGAPMGAIIRKGGFGYPILVAIIFFVIFIMLAITCKKLAELYYLTPFWAAMTPCIVLVPIAVYLTYQAMNDAQMFSTDRLDRFVAMLRNRFAQPKAFAGTL
jgi:lipopolysaccharide export system permease protein